MCDGGHQLGVVTWRQGAGQRPRQPWDVGGEDQLAVRSFSPSPGGDVVEEVPHVEDGGVHDAARDLQVAGLAAAPSADGVRGQEALDVAPVQLPQRRHLRMLSGEVLTEHGQRIAEAGHRRRAQHRQPGLEVAQHHPGDLRRGHTTVSRSSKLAALRRRVGGVSITLASNNSCRSPNSRAR